MSIPLRMAVTLPVPQGVEATLSRAVWAEERGYDDLWFADSSGIDSLTTSVAVAERTERVRIGTAIIPVYTRTPAVLASTTQVLHQISNGRFILGLGASSHTMMEGWNGVEFEKPLTRVKETAILVRKILNGEKTDFQGQTVRSKGYRQLALAPRRQAIYLAGLRPKMLEMAAEYGDGVILNLFPLNALPQMMTHINTGAQRAGKTKENCEVVCRHQIVVTNDKARVRDLFRVSFAPYYATPVYNKFLDWAGFPQAAATIREGWAEKDRAKTTRALDDEIVDQIAIIGSAEECYERIRTYAELGIHTHIVSCYSPEDTDATFEAFSPDHFSF